MKLEVLILYKSCGLKYGTDGDVPWMNKLVPDDYPSFGSGQEAELEEVPWFSMVLFPRRHLPQGNASLLSYSESLYNRSGTVPTRNTK